MAFLHKLQCWGEVSGMERPAKDIGNSRQETAALSGAALDEELNSTKKLDELGR